MANQIIPIYIPTYISSVDYQPARVLPRLLFYNGQLDCDTFYVDQSGSGVPVNQFPYFDNYNVVSGSFPTTGSKSLLFYNEEPAYGELPTSSLYNAYWSDYVNLLYNPRTRLVNASAIIPLADYFDIQLNDIAQFRGNYYHIRAINDYSLKDGTCTIQLLGPVFPAALPFAGEPVPTPSSQCCTPTLLSATQTGSNVNIAFTLPAEGECIACVATTVQISTDNVNWFGNNTAGCTSPRTISAPTSSVYYRIIQECSGSVTSSASNSVFFTPTTTTTTTTTAPPPTYCFDVLTGDVYPVTAANDSTSGSFINDSGETMYIWGKFNSGGNSSGSDSADSVTINGSTVLTFNDTITASGQTFYSQNAYTMSACDTIQVLLSKQDNLTSGASLRLAYSLQSDATKVDITEGGTGCCTTTTTTTTTTTAPPGESLYVYARTLNGDSDLSYNVNGGSNVYITQLTSSDCSFIYEITGLSVGDSVELYDDNGKSVAAEEGFDAGCPTTGTSCSYTMTIVSGANYVYLTFNAAVIC